MKQLYKALPRFFYVFLLLFAFALSAQAQWLAGYDYRKKVTIGAGNVTGTHANFPLLVELTDPVFQTVSGKVTDANGFDIAFTDNSHALLDYQLEDYDGAAGTVIAWVKFPSVTAAAQDFFVYYGNSAISTDQSTTDVWSNGFVGVWRLNGDQADYSGNGHNGTNNGATAGAGGQIVESHTFVRTESDYIQIAQDAELDIVGTEITISAWVNLTATQTQDAGVFIVSTDAYEKHLGVQSSDQANFRITTVGGNSYVTGTTVLTPGTWYHISGKYDGTTTGVYVNAGSAETTLANSGSILYANEPPLIGRRALNINNVDAADNRFFDGQIDHIELSDVARSDNWIQTEYDNQLNPSGFVVLDAAEESCVNKPDVVLDPTSQTVCSGVASSIDVTNPNTFATDYNWTAIYDGVAGGASSGSLGGGGAQVLSETLTYVSSPGTATYTVTPTNGTCDGNSENVIITVIPEPDNTLAVIPNNSTICDGETVTIEVQLSEPGIIYELRDNGTNLPISSISVGNGGSIFMVSDPISSPLTIKVTAQNLSADNCEVDLMDIEAIGVNPIPSNPSLDAPWATFLRRVCENEIIAPPVVSLPVSGTVGWYSNAALTVPIVTADPLLPTLVELGLDTSIPGLNTIYLAETVAGCISSGQQVRMFVNALPIDKNILPASLPANTCFNETQTLEVELSQTGVSYQLEVDGIAHGLAQNGDGGSLFFTSDPLTVLGIRSFQIVASNVANSCGIILSDVLSSTVQPATGPPVPDNAVIDYCVGDVAMAADFNVTGGAPLRWYNDAALTMLNHTGVVGNPAVDLGVNTGIASSNTYYVTQVVNTCEGTAATVTVNITPLPVDKTLAGSTDICEDDAVSITVQASEAGVSYQLWVDPPGVAPNVATGMDVVGIAGVDIVVVSDPLDHLIGTNVFTVVATNASTSCSFLLTTSLNVDVEEKPLGTTNTESAECSDAAFTIILQDNINGNNSIPSTFAWTATYPAGLTGGMGTGTGDISETLTNLSGGALNATYTVVPTAIAGLNCEGLPFVITVPIDPGPVMTAVTDITVCPGATIGPITFSANTGGGETFNWTNDNAGIGVGLSGSGDIASWAAPGNVTGSPITANFSVTGTLAGCTGPAETWVVTVLPEPQIDPIANVVVCPGDPVSVTITGDVAGATYSWTNTNTAIGLGASGSGDISFTGATNLSGTPIVGTVTVSASSNGCSTDISREETFTITIDPTPVMTAVTDITVCPGATIGPITFSANTGGGETFNWTNDNAGIGVGLSGSGDIASWAAPGNVTGSPITANFSVTGTLAGCTGPAETWVVTVLPEPQIDPIANVVVCPGDPVSVTITGDVAGATYSWTNTNTAIGLGASGSGDISFTGATNLSGTPIVGTVTVSASSNGCSTDISREETFTITIDPTPVMTAVTDITVCPGATIGPITFSANTGGGETFNWTNDNAGIGVGLSGSGDIASWAAPGNVTGSPITANFSVTGTLAGCTGPAETWVVTVLPEPQIDPIANVVVCPGDPVSVTITGDVAGATYSWTNTNTAIGLGASGSGDISFTGATNLSGTPIVGTVTVSASSNGCSTDISREETFTITIDPTPVMTAVTDITVCPGATIGPITFSANTGGGETFNWTNDNAGIGVGLSGSGDIASWAAPGNVTGSPITANFSVTGTLAGCTGPAETWVVTVLPEPQIDPIANVVVCPGDPVSVTITGDVAGATYSWTNTNTAIGLGASGSGDISFTGATNLSGTPIVGTVTVSASSNGCSTDISREETFTITIDPTPVMTAVTDITVCPGATIGPITFSANTGGGETFNWTNDNAGIGVGLSGSGDIASWAAPGNVTGSPITANFSVTGTLAGCTGPAETWVVTVLPEPQIDPIANVVVCPGDPVSVTITGDVAGATYSWTNTNTAIGLGASGSGDISFTGATNLSGTPIVGTVTVSASSNGCSTDISREETFTITIDPTPVMTAVTDITVCPGATIGPITFSANTGGGETFNWTNDNAGIGVGLSGSGDIASWAAPGNVTGSPITANFSVTGTLAGCTGPAETWVVTVLPEPQIDPIANVVVCPGDPVSVTITGDVAGATYSWTNTNTAIGLGASGSGDISFTGATNLSGTPIVGTVTVSASSNGCSTDISREETFTITIDPTPVMTAVTDITVCPGATIGPITFSANTGGGETFNWTNDNAGIGVGLSGSGDIASWAAPGNVTGSPITANFSVTGTLAGCTGPAETWVVTVLPEPQIDPIANVVVCPGDPVSVTITGDVAGATYSWTNTNTAIGLGASGSGDISFTGATNLSGTPIVGTVTVSASSNGCSTDISREETFTITIDPTPVMTAVTDITVCPGATIGPITFSANTGGGETFNWTNDNAGIGVGLSGSGDIASWAAPGNVTGSPITANFSVTGTLAGCTGPAETWVVTVLPEPQIDPIANVVVCPGDPVSVTITGDVAGATYSWTNTNTAIGLGASGSGDISFTGATNLSGTPIVGTVTVSASSNGCSTDISREETFTITIDPTPVMTAVTDITVCPGATIGPITFSANTGGGETFNWTNDNAGIGVGLSGSGDIASWAAPGNVTGSPITANFSVTGTLAGCTGPAETWVVTVLPEPQIDPIANVVVCPGDPVSVTITGDVAGATYSWTNTNTAIGLGASGSGDISFTGATNLSGTPIVGTVTVSASSNGCSTDISREETFTITIDPTPVMTAVTDITVCPGATIGPITFSANTGGGETFNWTNDNAGIGVGLSGSGDIASWAAPGNVTGSPITANFSVTGTLAGCTGPAETWVVTVLPEPQIDPIANVVVCPGDPVSVTITGDVAGATYSWTNTNTAIGLGASGSGDISFTGATNLSGTPIVGTVTVSASSNGCSTDISREETFTITIDPTPVMTAVTDITVCPGATIGPITFSANTGGGETFNWTNDNAGIGVGLSGSGDIASWAAPGNVTGSPITANFSVTGTLAGCTGPAETWVVTVLPEPQIDPIANVVVCPGDPVSVTITGDVAGATYSWTNTNTAIGLGASGSGDISFTGATNLSGTPIVGTVTVSASSNGCSTDISREETFTITIDPTPVMTAVTDITVCPGATIGPITFSANTGGGETFNWTNDNAGIGVGLSGSGDIASWAAPGNVTGSPITANFSVTGTLAGCTGPAETWVVTVLPEPQIDPIANVVVCPGDPVSVTITGDVAGATYSWTNTNTAIGLGASGSGDISFTGATNLSGTPIVGTVTVSASSNGCSTDISREETFTITIDPTPVMTAVTDITVCPGATIGPITFSANTGGGETFNWTNDNAGIGVGLSGSGDIASWAAPGNVTGSPITANFSVTGTLAGCTGPAETWVVTVLPEPQIDPIANVVVCPGDPVSVTITGDVAGATYSWTNTNTAIGLGASGSGDISFTGATNLSGTPIVGTVTVSASSNGCSTDISREETFTITIDPTPVMTAVTDITVCPGATIGPITFSANTGGGETFNWTNDNAGIGVGLSGSGDIASWAAPGNVTGSPITANFSVTGTLAGCTGPAETWVVTVLPEPQIDPIANVVVCPGDPVSVTITGDVAGATYSWTNTNTAIGLGASGSGDISFTGATNLSGTPIVGTVTVSASSNGCSTDISREETFTITIDPTPVMTAVTDITVCPGATIGPITFSANTGGGETFNWTNDNAGIGVGLSGSGDIASWAAPGNVTGSPITANFSVTGTLASCTGPAETWIVTILPDPVVAAQVDITVCPGDPISALFSANTGGSEVFSWTNSNTNIGLPATGNGDITYLAPNNISGADEVGMISVTATKDGCTGPAMLFNITIRSSPVITTQPSDPAPICEGTGVRTISVVASGASLSYIWEFSANNGLSWANATGAPYSGETTADLTITSPTSAINSYLYRVQINGVCVPGVTSASARVSILEQPEVTDPLDLQVCSTGTASFSVDPGNTTNPIFQWQVDPNTGTFSDITVAGPEGYTGFNGSALNITNLVGLDQYKYRVNVTGDCDLVTGATSMQAVLTVDEPLVITTNVANQVVCDGDPAAFGVIVSGSGPIAYQWEISTDGGFVWNPIPLEMSATLNIAAVSPAENGYRYRVQVSTTNSCGTNLLSNEGLLVVNEPAVVTADPSDVVICEGNNTSLFILATGTALSYQWELSTDGGGIWNPILGETNSLLNLFNVTPSMDGHMFRNVVTSASGCGNDVSMAATLTVNEFPQIDVQPSLPPGVCQDVNVITISAVGSGSSIMYQWQESTDGGMNFFNLAEATFYSGTQTSTLTITNAVLAMDDYEYRVVVSGACSPSIASGQVAITVNPVPTFTVGNIKPIICSEELTDIPINSPTIGAKITLINVTADPGIVGYSSIGSEFLDGSTIADLLVNTSNMVGMVTYEFQVDAEGCTGASTISESVTVNPIPNVAASQSIQTICDGGTTSILLSNPNGVATTAFNWTVTADPGIGNAMPGSGNSIAQMLTNSTNAPAVVVYNVIPEANGCFGDDIDIIVTVNPTPDILTSGNETLCSPDQTNITISNPNGVVGTAFNWTVTNITNGILGANNGSGILIAQNLINPNANLSGSVTYRITPIANGCPGAFTDVVVTVNSPPTVDAGLDLAICDGDIAMLNGSFGGSATSVMWSGYGGTIGNANSPVTTYAPSGAEISAGTVTLTLTTNDPDGGGATGPCIAVSEDVIITINPLPTVSILQPAANQYAQSDPSVPLLGSPASPPGVWAGQGVLSGFYVPIAVTIPSGDDFVLDNVSYTYTDLNGCVNSDSKIIRVDANPDVEFGAKPGQDYCENEGIINLVNDLEPNITGGTWSGPGIIDGILGLFDPDLAGVTTHAIVYTVVDPVTSGVTNAPVTIRVHPKPKVDFNIGNLCALDSIQFFDASTVSKVFSEDTITIWNWNFNNERVDNTQNPVVFFSDPGTKDITLSVKTLANSVGCVADTTVTATFGKPPIIDFEWTSICFNDTTLFEDKTVLLPGSTDAIANYNWNFGDGNNINGAPGTNITDGTHPNGSVSFGQYQGPAHQYVNAAKGDLFDVRLDVTTTSGCLDSLVQRVEILPAQALTISQGYLEDFESDRGGWFVESDLGFQGVLEADTSWIWGVADGARINSQGDPATNNVWWTGANLVDTTAYTYLDGERSVVNGPCFDFRGIQRPMVSFDYFTSSEENKDGAVFEYSLDGGQSWTTIGQKDQGVDWYNSTSIVSNPGQNNLGNGWTSDTATTWRNARFTLPNNIISNSKVRVRFYFAANGDNEDAPMNGYGFDNVFIGEKKRTVLAENFTNANEIEYDIVNAKMNTIDAAVGSEDFYYINYHVSDGDPDQFNTDNDAPPRIRSAKYGLSQAIHTIIDGSGTAPYGFSGLSVDPLLNSTRIDSRSLMSPPFNIDNITIAATTENIIDVKYDISNNENFDRPVRIFTTVIEKNIVDNIVGFNVVKKMLPDATGLEFLLNWTYNPATMTGTTIPLATVLEANGLTGETSLIWDLNTENKDYIYDPANLTVVIYIQDQETNEIYQAAYMDVVDNKQPNNITGIEEELVGELTTINIYPNPVLNDMHFVLPDGDVLSRDDFYWKLIDQRGVTMLEGDLLFRNGRITVSTETVQNGMYHLVMGVEGKPMIYRKIAVMHR